MLRKVPLIIILGSTGTGKTKLSIELAERFGGQIISADSMQVYTDLDIVTAKATKTEQSLVPHHILDIVQPTQPYTVVDFQNTALPIIDDLLAKSKCPIVVGGTNYYIESLLWDVLIGPHITNSRQTMMTQVSTSSTNNHNNELELECLSSEKLHERLREIDPITAERMHPNNRRKILRALEVFEHTGVPLSTIISQQRNQPGGNRLGGPLRYPHTILFWLRCNQDILNNRLDKRVDSMLEQGLLKEVRSFHEKYFKPSNNNECTKGILQSIGFKEFIPYLEQFKTDQDIIIEKYLKQNSYILSTTPNENEPQGLDLLRQCLDELKLVTKRYSKKQIKWIRNRLLGSKDRQVPPLYALDTSDVDMWKNNVYLPAIDVIDSYMNEKITNQQPMEKIQHPSDGLNEEVSNYCEICKRNFIGEYQWILHLKSNKHKKVKDGLRRKSQINQQLLLNIK